MTVRDIDTLKSYFVDGAVPNGQQYADLVDTLFSAFPVNDGWIIANETWTRVNGYTFTTPGDKTWKYKTGVKVKFTDTTIKYGYVASSSYSAPNTTVVLVANNDYSIVGATITVNSISFYNPPDFPEWFNYTPTWTAAITPPTFGNATIAGRFKIQGRKCELNFVFLFGSTSGPGSGIWAFGLPIISANPSGGFGYQWLGVAHTRKSGVNNFESVIAVLQNRTDISQFTDPDWTSNVNNYGGGTPFVWGGGDSIRFSVSYEV